MRAAGHGFEVLSVAEEEAIHRNILRLVDGVGLQVENEVLLERMAAIGGRVDREKQRVTFSPDATEAFMASCRRADGGLAHGGVSGGVELYYGHYLDPQTDEFLPMTVELARRYYQVARGLKHISGYGILGCPLEGVPTAYEPLYERYYAWDLGVHPGGSIHQLRHAPAILEMTQCHAAALGIRPEQAFSGVVYLVPPLKLAYQEAAQVEWFLARGLRVSVGGSMATGGATAPVTLAGMVTLTIAEGLLLAMLNRALFGDRGWGIHMSATALDMRTMMRPYGRPDMAIANLMAAQMARRYGVGCSGHCGLTDAPRPGYEAAAQKAQSALPTLLATGHAGIPAGLLAVDEVFSPLQMALDDELIASLQVFAQEYEVSDESIGADVIAAVGPGGNFAAELHTAEWFRRELWEPSLFTRRNFAAWREVEGKAELDRAREKVLAILAEPAPPSFITAQEDRDLRAIIARASQ